MANFRGERYIQEAIDSVLAQTFVNFRLIISDDYSDDASLDIALSAAARDKRILVLTSTIRGGAAAARNRALDAATGDWIAIMDSDDVMHPTRLARLLEVARITGADAVADDLVYFGDTPALDARTLLQAASLVGTAEVDAAEFLASNVGDSRFPPLGLLKPLVRRMAIKSLRYDPSLPLGEDDHFYLRLLLAGARLVIFSEGLYLYRRHTGSSSHRPTAATLQAMIKAEEALIGSLELPDPRVTKLLFKRLELLTKWRDFSLLTEHIKQKRLVAASRALLARPALFRELRRSLLERREKWKRTQSVARRDRQTIVIGPQGGVVPSCYSNHRYISLSAESALDAKTWADLSREAASTALHLVGLGNEGLSAAWRVPAASRITIVAQPDANLSLPIPPRGERVSFAELDWERTSQRS